MLPYFNHWGLQLSYRQIKMKLIILLFSSIVLGFLLSVFLIKQYNIDVPPIFTGGLITAIGYFIFKNKIEEDEN
jgi:general stress protein CsbA